jgi:hypothetical protein
MQSVVKTKLKNKVDFKAFPHPLLKEIKKTTGSSLRNHFFKGRSSWTWTAN